MFKNSRGYDFSCKMTTIHHIYNINVCSSIWLEKFEIVNNLMSIKWDVKLFQLNLRESKGIGNMHHISSNLNLLRTAHQILMRQLFDGLMQNLTAAFNFIWMIIPILDFKIIFNVVKNINLLFLSHRSLIFYWTIVCSILQYFTRPNH